MSLFKPKEVIRTLRATTRQKFIHYSAWFLFIIVLGILLSAGIWKGGSRFYAFLEERGIASAEETVPEFSPRSAESFKVIWDNVSDFEFKPLSHGKTIRANLKTMKLYLYQDGGLVNTFDIVSKAKKGSYWETPGGEYKVVAKEDNHFSPNAKVWMPYSVQFFGSYFIHGWPYDQNGRDLSISNALGCIRLRTEDARAVYDFADTNTVVSVYGDSVRAPTAIGSGVDYFLKDPAKKLSLSSDAYVVADIETGEVILEKSPSRQYPIASTTKLMTALASYDIIDLDDVTTVSKQAVNTYGYNGAFRAGEKVRTADLIYPLLLESSNDAGEILAEHAGRRYFMEAMNRKARDIGMESTSFEDPSGLSPNNVSTAYDLFALARHIYEEKPQIYNITTQETIARSGHLWRNKGQFSRDPQYVGGKTGFTNPAKQTLVAVFEIPLSEFDTRKIGIVILQSDNRAGDVSSILRYLKENVYYGQRELAPLPPVVDPEAGEDHEHEADPEILLSFVGDIMLDRGVESSVSKNFGGDFSRLFDNLRFLRESDILFGNLEGPASDKGRNVGSKYSFRMDPSVLDTLKEAGFDVLSFANNHVGDWSKEAFLDTLYRLEEKGLNPTGAGRGKRDAADVRIVEVKGTKVGYLGFSDVGPDWMEARESSAGILLAKDKDMEKIISAADKKVDILVVSFHWGEEYREHSERQELLARKAVDAGAEIVAGHHPHVIQDVETYKGAVIAYSLGNFIFDQYFSEETMQGLLLEVRVKDRKIQGYEEKVIRLNRQFQPESVEVR